MILYSMRMDRTRPHSSTVPVADVPALNDVLPAKWRPGVSIKQHDQFRGRRGPDEHIHKIEKVSFVDKSAVCVAIR